MYKFNLLCRLDNYLKLSQKINDELLKRDLTNISTNVLLKVSIANDNRVKEITNKSIEIGSNSSCFYLGANENGFFELNLDE